MIEAGFWGLAAAAGLLLGAGAALRLRVDRRVVGLAMGFAAGLLIAAFGFELDEKAYELGGGPAAVLGFTGGVLAFYAAGRVAERRGGGGLLTAPVLNGVPESVAIAITLVEDGDVGGAIVAVVFLSNIAEALGAGIAARQAGRPRRAVVRLWTVVALTCGLAAAISYGLLQSAPDGVVAVTQAAAIGAVVCMAFGTMLPRAMENRDTATGLAATLGFALAFAMSIA